MMATSLTHELTVPQITRLVQKANKERSNLDEMGLKKLDNVHNVEAALDAAKREVELHRKIETARREMETRMRALDEEIQVLETKEAGRKDSFRGEIGSSTNGTSTRTDLHQELTFPF